MDKEELRKMLVVKFGSDSYIKGTYYDDSKISYLRSYDMYDGTIIHNLKVESSEAYDYYFVKILIRNNEILRGTCTCPQCNRMMTCKHIVACILKYANDMFVKPKDVYDITNELLDLYVDKSKNTIREKLNLELELDFSYNNLVFKPFIGKDKMYTINNETRFSDFMSAYLNGGTYYFGVKFTYDSSKYFLSDEDDRLIKFLYSYDKNKYYTYNGIEAFMLTEREENILFDYLKDTKFKIKGYGYVNGVERKLPTDIKLEKENGDYKIIIDDIENYIVANRKCKYIIYNKILYIVPDVYTKMLNVLHENQFVNFLVSKDKVKIFKNGLLKHIKNDIIIDDEIEDIVVNAKPEVSLYFDLYKNLIKCEIKLKYKNKIINYFDKDDSIIRDEKIENLVLEDLIKNNFKIDDNKIVLEDIDNVGAFISEGLNNLKDKYYIYTTKKLDSMNIIKKSKIESNFSIGVAGVMSYDFKIDNIDSSELDNIFNSLKNKKRYYKLKNGNLINLEENDELKELNNLFTDLEFNPKDLSSGNIEIPKYRAFYIDSLRNNKYKSINTNSIFDEFINNFKKYKNIEINLNKKDKEILRPYQIDGIKWLYTLYKCDLGGILADEMGLGKSIQTIYFIKEIIKEKKDAKILIVCPTALVYNWVSEFDKFGSELKYVAVAENKEKRKDVINNFDKYNIFITTYGLIRNDNDEYENKEFELCVIDEAQAIKNYQAGMTKEVKKIKSKTKIALTGTPLENSIMELWSIFDFIMPGYLNGLKKFREKYGINDIDEDSLSKLNLLNYQIKPFILRRKKKDVIKDLPDKSENNIYLELPKMQKAIYVKVLNETKKEMDELIVTEGWVKARFKILQLLMKLRQICVDPNVLYEDYQYESIKIEKLVEIVKDYVIEGHKILIFSSFKRVIDNVKKIFDQEDISSYIITGEVKGKERKELVDKFNNDDTNCFLITLKSGGTGLNLTGADIVIHLDIWWNPQVENQATDRTHRIGQKNKVTVIRLITKGTIEERIIELQNKKKVLSDNLIEGKDNSTLLNSITEKEMKKLLSYGEDEV